MNLGHCLYLCPIMAEPRGKLRRQKIFQHLESSVVICVAIPENYPQTFDGMVLLQKLSKMLKACSDISDYILKQVLRGCTRVAFFVTDYYLEDSVKSIKRDSRFIYGTIKMKMMSRQQMTPKQWKNFLWNPEKNIDLIDFLLLDWLTNPKHSQQPHGNALYMTNRDEVHIISSVHWLIVCKQVQELSSKQEEPDTKNFLFAKFAAFLGFLNQLLLLLLIQML